MLALSNPKPSSASSGRISRRASDVGVISPNPSVVRVTSETLSACTRSEPAASTSGSKRKLPGM